MWPPKNGTVDTVDFSGLCSDQQLSFFTLLDRASFPHYNNTKIIKFGWELFILWVISYGLSFSEFARFAEFRGTINDSFSSTCANTYQHSTSYKEISVPMTYLDCKSLLGNTRITEHNTRSIYGWPKPLYHLYSFFTRLWIVHSLYLRIKRHYLNVEFLLMEGNWL